MTIQNHEAYAIGTTVFVPSILTKQIAVTCPDCQGGNKWNVTTPGGAAFTIDCPRCHGGKQDWLWPKRHERVLEIKETTISQVSISLRQWKNDEEVHANTEYHTHGGYSSIKHDKVHLTREAAEARGAEMLAEEEARELTDWEKEQQRTLERSKMTIVDALNSNALERYTDLKERVDKLKEGMLEAISWPTLNGPDVHKPTYGAPAITNDAMAEWCEKLLSDAGIDGWTEAELHEAKCSC